MPKDCYLLQIPSDMLTGGWITILSADTAAKCLNYAVKQGKQHFRIDTLHRFMRHNGTEPKGDSEIEKLLIMRRQLRRLAEKAVIGDRGRR